MTDIQQRAEEALSSNDYDSLMPLLKQGLQRREIWAARLAGFCYLNGHGVERDLEASQHFFQQAIDQGDADAKLGKAYCLSFLESSDEDDFAYEILTSDFEKTPSIHNAMALARLLLKPNRIEHLDHTAEGEKYLAYAADQGSSDAAKWLGSRHFHAAQPNKVEALKWFKVGADLGDTECMRVVGQFFREGSGTSVNTNAAKDYLEKAADHGSVVAMHELGVMYADGEFGSVNHKEAYRWFSSASARGSYLSSESMAKMFRFGQVDQHGEFPMMALCLTLIAKQQAFYAEQNHLDYDAEIARLAAEIPSEELVSIAVSLEILSGDNSRWPMEALASLYEQGLFVEADPEAGSIWRQKALAAISHVPDESDRQSMSNAPSNLALPKETEAVAERLTRLGFSDEQVHGVFVFLGLYVGTPRTEEALKEVFEQLEKSIPTERQRNIVDLVADFYPGYVDVLEEYVHRLDWPFPADCVVFKPRIHGLLPEIKREKLADATRLTMGLLHQLGASTSVGGQTYKQSFYCGVYQAQLIGVADSEAAQHIEAALFDLLPLVVGEALNALRHDNREYFLALENGQIPFSALASSKSEEYTQLVWAFQSSLFYRDQKPIANINRLTVQQWHEWAYRNALAFGERHLDALLPFALSGHVLNGIPTWPSEIADFDAVDVSIYKIWGYQASELTSLIEELEYKALVIHLVYSSLTQSLDHVK